MLLPDACTRNLCITRPKLRRELTDSSPCLTIRGDDFKFYKTLFYCHNSYDLELDGKFNTDNTVEGHTHSVY